MSELADYVIAVSKRKAVNQKTNSTIINAAIVMQLEKDDIPRMLEIIREQDKAICTIIDLVDECEDDNSTEAKMFKACAEAHLRVEELALAGNKKRWGDYVPENRECDD